MKPKRHEELILKQLLLHPTWPLEENWAEERERKKKYLNRSRPGFTDYLSETPGLKNGILR